MITGLPEYFSAPMFSRKNFTDFPAVGVGRLADLYLFNQKSERSDTRISYPEDFCREIAYRQMNTDYTATRMLGYLYRISEPRPELPV